MDDAVGAVDELAGLTMIGEQRSSSDIVLDRCSLSEIQGCGELL